MTQSSTSSPHDHPLFQRHPLSGRVTLSTGAAPMPYHIYDGYGLFIGGTCDLAAAQQLLKPEQVTPVQTTDGHALLGVWVCDFTEASLGSHHELQFSIFVSSQPVAPIELRPFTILALMLTRPDIQMLCHGLWNNTPTVVAYNREYLSLNARQTDSRIEREPNALRFAFNDQVTGQAILAGTVQQPQRKSWRANWNFMTTLGFKRSLAVQRQPWINMTVLNPMGVMLDRNAAARTFTSNAVTVLRYFDQRTDRLDFGDTPYRALCFTPQFVQYMAGFKFVYLQPQSDRL
jgi:hypothetical protein